jgi:ParB family chromosome partitioning protein
LVAEKPIEKPVDKVVEKPVEKPVDKVVENLKKLNITDENEIAEIKSMIEKLGESLKKTKEESKHLAPINRDLFR